MTRDVDSRPHCERDKGAEDCAIEITPEMVEAGAAALYGLDKRFYTDEEIVSGIYRAMAKRHRSI